VTSIRLEPDISDGLAEISVAGNRNIALWSISRRGFIEFLMLFILKVKVLIQNLVTVELMKSYCLPYITARCTLVQSAVLRSHVVCSSVHLSVCNVGGL